MTRRTLIPTLALAFLAILGLAHATPLHAGAEGARTAVDLPAGHVLVGQVVEGRWVVLPTPAERLAPPGPAGGAKECENDVLSDYATTSRHGIARNVAWPFAENAASRGVCVEETHAGPVSYMEFRTSGDYYGMVHVSGTGARYPGSGSFSISCIPFGAAFGVPGPESWVPLLVGRDYHCTVDTWGLQPHEWDSWSGVVTNYHFYAGSTRAFFL